MVAVRVSPFGGMIPAVDDRLLPEINAAHSENTWLYSGTVIGMPEEKLLRTNTNNTVTKVYRIPNGSPDAIHLEDSIWMEFTNPDTDVIRSQVVDDTFDRYYWASPGDAPMYNTRARIAAGDPGYLLGIPSPVLTSVTPVGGASATLVARAYTTTFVSAYGEEGPPSNSVNVTSAKIDASFDLVMVAADAADIGGPDRNLTHRRIYRTITALDGTTTFFFVVELPIATLTYSDTATDLVISANSQLESTTWTGPPLDLQGWVTIGNGMVAGFRENEVWFCEPFRMHAWPALYTLAVEYPIVGLGVYNQTLMVLTQGFPHTVNGSSPASMSVTKLAGLLPCTSRGSIVSTVEGVYYSAPEGLVLMNSGGIVVASKELIRKDKWNSAVPTPTLRAVRLASAYFGYGSARFGVFEETAFDTDAFTQEDFGDARRGTLIDATSPTVAFNYMSIDKGQGPVSNVMMDAWSGEVFIIRDDKTYWVDIGDVTQPRRAYTWRSKIYQPSDRKNFQAMKIYFRVPPGSPDLNPVPNDDQVQKLAADQYGLVRVYAGTEEANLELVMTREIRISGEQMRMPSGFKFDYWQWEIEARVEILSLQAATSPSELRVA